MEDNHEDGCIDVYMRQEHATILLLSLNVSNQVTKDQPATIKINKVYTYAIPNKVNKFRMVLHNFISPLIQALKQEGNTTKNSITIYL